MMATWFLFIICGGRCDYVCIIVYYYVVWLWSCSFHVNVFHDEFLFLCCSETASQHDAATPVLDVWVDVLRFTSLSVFPSTFDGCHYSQTVATLVFFHKTRLVNFRSLPRWLFVNCNLAFYVSFWESVSPPLRSLSAHVGAGLVSLWMMKLYN